MADHTDALLVVAELPALTGISRDIVTMNFVVALDPAFSYANADLDDILNKFEDFFEVADPGIGSTLGVIIGPSVSRVADSGILSAYVITDHLDGSPHGSPVRMDTFTLANNDGTGPLPQEVAIAVTLEATGRSTALVEAVDGADPGAAVDRPRSRLTGRFFWGPLPKSAAATIDNVARPVPDFCTLLRNKIGTLHTALEALTNVDGLGVWSRVNENVVELEAVSTDNEFDTQRRRGRRATLRVRQTV